MDPVLVPELKFCISFNFRNFFFCPTTKLSSLASLLYPFSLVGFLLRRNVFLDQSPVENQILIAFVCVRRLHLSTAI